MTSMNEASYRNQIQKKIESERSTAKQIIFSISTKLWVFVRLNVLFLLFSIPVVTAPAAFSGMTKVLMNLVRRDNCEVWKDFWVEFKASFIKSFIAGLIFVGCVTIIVLLGRSIFGSLNNFSGALGAAVLFVFGVMVYVAFCYVFTQSSILDISLKKCFKNALILLLIEPKRNVMLLIPLLLLLLGGILFPLSLPIFLFVAFALCQYIVCKVVNTVIQKRLIEPFNAVDNG